MGFPWLSFASDVSRMMGSAEHNQPSRDTFTLPVIRGNPGGSKASQRAFGEGSG
jgi:hypothetical protein